jgi:elongation factor P
MQYLYQDGDLFYFMDTENYEQIGLNADKVGDALKFVKENEMVKVCSHNGNVFAIERFTNKLFNSMFVISDH